MKIKFLIVIGIIVTVFLMGTIVYPFIYETTFDDDYPHDIQTTLDNVSQIHPEPNVTDSLKIPNAERDAKLAAGYKLYPGVGWVHPDDLGNQQPIYRDNPNNPGELVLDIDAMIKVKESKQERTPPPEPPFEKEDSITKIEVMFGERLSNHLIPVTFTEVTTNAEELDEITVWNFELVGHSGDDRYVAWDVLSKDRRIGYEITDGDTGLDAIDRTIMPEYYAIPADQHLYEMDCGLFFTIEGESAHPTSFPIKNNIHNIFAKNSRIGIFPDSNDEYSFEFASIFKHTVRFNDDMYDFLEIISQETKECDAKWQIDGKSEKESGNGYYTKMSFRFE